MPPIDHAREIAHHARLTLLLRYHDERQVFASSIQREPRRSAIYPPVESVHTGNPRVGWAWIDLRLCQRGWHIDFGIHSGFGDLSMWRLHAKGKHENPPKPLDYNTLTD